MTNCLQIPQRKACFFGSEVWKEPVLAIIFWSVSSVWSPQGSRGWTFRTACSWEWRQLSLGVIQELSWRASYQSTCWGFLRRSWWDFKRKLSKGQVSKRCGQATASSCHIPSIRWVMKTSLDLIRGKSCITLNGRGRCFFLIMMYMPSKILFSETIYTITDSPSDSQGVYLHKL